MTQQADVRGGGFDEPDTQVLDRVHGGVDDDDDDDDDQGSPEAPRQQLIRDFGGAMVLTGQALRLVPFTLRHYLTEVVRQGKARYRVVPLLEHQHRAPFQRVDVVRPDHHNLLHGVER